MKRLMMWVGLLASVCALAACSPSPSTENTFDHQPISQLKLNGSVVDDPELGGDFALTDQNGKRVHLADFHGKIVALFFGYTRCPDVCPTSMLDLAQVMSLLGEDADKLQVVFVSVDPERDTPQVLKDYVPLFDERFVGLTAADEAEIAPILKQWQIAASKVPGKDGFYSIDHSAGMYLISRSGDNKVYLPYGSTPEQIAADVRSLQQLP